jgi:hypothetical protein
MTSKSEAVLEIQCCGLKPLNWGVGEGGGGEGEAPCAACSDNQSRRQVKQDAQDRGEVGGGCLFPCPLPVFLSAVHPAGAR